MSGRFAYLATLAVLTASLSLGAQAADAPAKPAKPPKSLTVLTAEAVDASRLLSPPPADGGDVNQAELSDLHRIIAARTPQRLAAAKWDDEHEDPSAYYATIGGGFDLKTLPATADLFAVVMNDQSVASSLAKKHFSRKRPWAVDPTIATCDPGDKPLTSYPSGHATMGYSVGLVLAALIPEKAEAIQMRAADYALSREICGSHYPSDVEASHVLAAVVATDLMNSSALQPKIAAARAELRAAHFTAQ